MDGQGRRGTDLAVDARVVVEVRAPCLLAGDPVQLSAHVVGAAPSVRGLDLQLRRCLPARDHVSLVDGLGGEGEGARVEPHEARCIPVDGQDAEEWGPLERGQGPALFGCGRVDPEGAPVHVCLDDDVVEGKRRRRPGIQNLAAARSHEHRTRLETELAQDPDEQEGLVLAIAEAAGQDLGGRVGRVAVPSHLHPEVAHLVLDEPDGGQGSIGRCRLPSEASGLGRHGPAIAADIEKPRGPGRHFRPVLVIGHLHPRVRLEVAGEIAVGVDRLDVAQVPGPLPPRGHLPDLGLRGRRVALHPGRTPPGKSDSLPQAIDGHGIPEVEVGGGLAFEERVRAFVAVGVVDDVADADVPQEHEGREAAVVDTAVELALLLDDLHVRERE